MTEPPDIFTKRGISPDVVRVRGYRAYAAGADADEIPELAAHPRYLAKNCGPSSGWLMPKYPVSDDLPPIRPQIRPDDDTHVPKYVLPPRIKPDDSKRLDRHPATDFTQPGRTFFVIEGTPKNDALVTCGEKSFDVPSVAQWSAPELAPFARAYLMSDPVLVVPDSDWAENSEVIFHAISCREYLRRLGVDAHVASPPPRDEPDATGSLKQGVDDFLGPEGSPPRRRSPGELLVLRREVDEEAFKSWWDNHYLPWCAIQRGARGAYRKTLDLDERVARMIVLTSHDRRTLRGVQSLTRAVCGEQPRLPKKRLAAMDEIEIEMFNDAWTGDDHRVMRALDRLEAAGAFTYTGAFPRWMLAGTKRVRGKGGKFKHVAHGAGFRSATPEIKLDAQLRLTEHEPIKLDKFLEEK